MRYEHRVIEEWPGKLRASFQRHASPFKVTWSRTLDDLATELGHLRAKDTVLETAHAEKDRRLDGSVKSSAGRPEHPGVILSFTSRHGDLRYWTDVYSDWGANVRAISLGLQALRAVDRYGITSTGQQYTGWAKLPPGQTAPAPVARTMSPEYARGVVAQALGLGTAALTTADPDLLRTMYRQAARRVHPDVGGSAEGWAKLNEAAAVLGLREPVRAGG